jgi:hypothetical protein
LLLDKKERWGRGEHEKSKTGTLNKVRRRERSRKR